MLRRRVKKVYLKCQVRNCQQAFRTFMSVKSFNVHHWIYHPKVLFSCPICPKQHHTHSSVRFHKYEHQALRYTCTTCNKPYIYQSKLRQHRRAHVQHRMYQCFYGCCNKQYKYPQDLDRHVVSHLGKKFEHPLCNYSSDQKGYLNVTQLCINLNQGIFAKVVVWVSNITIRYIDTDKSASKMVFTGIMEY